MGFESQDVGICFLPRYRARMNRNEAWGLGGVFNFNLGYCDESNNKDEHI